MEKEEIQAIVKDVQASVSRKNWKLAVKTRIKLAKGEAVRPEPENEKVDDYVRAVADRICDDHYSHTKGKTLLIRFVWGKSELISVTVNVKTGEISRVFNKGDLLGALVAFKENDKINMGWSVYNKNHEPFPSIRKDAIRIAVIRGIVDGITNDGLNWVTTSGIDIPVKISGGFSEFAKRIEKYYFKYPDNLIIR